MLNFVQNPKPIANQPMAKFVLCKFREISEGNFLTQNQNLTEINIPSTPLKECRVPFPKINGLTLEENPLRPENGTAGL